MTLSVSPQSGSIFPSNADTKTLAQVNSTSTSNSAASGPAPSKPVTKAKPRKRVNTAEKRSQHNAIERARRETLNSKFLVLAGLLPALASHRRPSKSAIVNNSISHLSFQRNQRLLAARIMRELRADRDSILEELNAWRSRGGHPPRQADLIWSDEAEDMCRNVDQETFGTFTNFGEDGDGEGEGDDEEDTDMQADPASQSQGNSARGSTGGMSTAPWDQQMPTSSSFDQAQLLSAAAQAQNLSWSHEFAFKLANSGHDNSQSTNPGLAAAINTVANALSMPQPPVHLPFSAFIPDHPSSSPSGLGSPTSISNSGGTTMLTPPRTADGLSGSVSFGNGTGMNSYTQFQSGQHQKHQQPLPGQFFVNPAGLVQTPSPGSSSSGDDRNTLRSSVSMSQSLPNPIPIPSSNMNSHSTSTPMAIPLPPSGGQWSAQQLLMLQQLQMRSQSQPHLPGLTTMQQNGMRHSQSAYPSHGSFDASSYSSQGSLSNGNGNGLDPSQFQLHMQRQHQQQQQQHHQQSADRIAQSLLEHMNTQNPSHQGQSYFQQQQQQQSLPLPSPFLPGMGPIMGTTPTSVPALTPTSGSMAGGGMTTPGGAVPEEQIQQWRQAALAGYLAQAQAQANANIQARSLAHGQGSRLQNMPMGWQGVETDSSNASGNAAALGLNGLGLGSEGVPVEGF